MGENQLSKSALLNIHPEIMIKPDERVIRIQFYLYSIRKICFTECTELNVIFLLNTCMYFG